MTSRRTRIVASVAAALLLILFVIGAVINLEKAPETASRKDIDVPGGLYELKWDGKFRQEWSTRVTSVTKKGAQKFLGPFNERPLTLSLAALPPHQMVRVRFDLITYNPWNGDGRNFGRDLWDMRIVGGQPLIHTTFSNCGFFSNNNEQSFPDQYPWYPTHPGWTGAAAKQSLGWKENWGEGPKGVDSTYAFDITFPHTSDALNLQFKSQIKNHEQKMYGFLSFKVETIEHAAPMDEATLAARWQDLADEDPIKAYHAVWTMVAGGDSATSYVKLHLPPTDSSIPLNIDQTEKWEYGSFQYATPAARQRARAIHVLEAIGSPASMKILQEIGFTGTPQGGPPTNWGP